MNKKDYKDLWNTFLFKDCEFGEHDIPLCHTKITEIPQKIITYEQAKQIYLKEKKKGTIEKFFSNDFVCFYVDDYKFDTSEGIWKNPWKAFEVLKHFKGIISPDFSTYLDFPDPMKRYNIMRDRAFGAFWGKYDNGKFEVIPNVRGDITNLEYCFEGIDQNSIICIGTVASGLKSLKNRPLFEKWLIELVKTLTPKIIIVYGSANYSIFDKLCSLGITILQYSSVTSKYYEDKKYE